MIRLYWCWNWNSLQLHGFRWSWLRFPTYLWLIRWKCDLGYNLLKFIERRSVSPIISRSPSLEFIGALGPDCLETLHYVNFLKRVTKGDRFLSLWESGSHRLSNLPTCEEHLCLRFIKRLCIGILNREWWFLINLREIVELSLGSKNLQASFGNDFLLILPEAIRSISHLDCFSSLKND